jgi:hypothetical protein
MSLIYGGDDIAKAIRQDDETAMAGFRSAYTAHMDRLRAELADVRKSVADAERLTYRYAALIGEQRETMRIAATPSGIAAAIRRLDAGSALPTCCCRWSRHWLVSPSSTRALTASRKASTTLRCDSWT